jgi:hypothetical protein
MKDKLDKATLRLELRKLYDDSPEEFERIVKQLQVMAVANAINGPIFTDPNGIPMERTADYLNLVLPSVKIVRGKPVKLGDVSQACLLVKYRSRDGSREDFLDQASGLSFSNGYWTGKISVEDHLKAAEKKEKCDPDFAAFVSKLWDICVAVQHLRESNRLGPP